MVRCTCYEEGLATPPPVPVRVDEHDELRAVDPQESGRVWDWMRTACAHPGMAAAELHLGWRFIRSFRDDIVAAGDAYPVLRDNVPDVNGGWYLTPAEAARALVELERFVADHPPEWMDRLVDLNDPRAYAHTYSGETFGYLSAVLSDGTKARAGFHAGRFAVWLDDDPPLFAADVVEQRVGDEGAVLTDPATGNTLRLREPVWDGTEMFAVVRLLVTVPERYHAYTPTLELCLASVRTGHHVSWG